MRRGFIKGQPIRWSANPLLGEHIIWASVCIDGRLVTVSNDLYGAEVFLYLDAQKYVSDVVESVTEQIRKKVERLVVSEPIPAQTVAKDSKCPA